MMHIPQMYFFILLNILPLRLLKGKFAREIKKLILLCDQGVNHITCLSLNILLGKTRRLGSIV